ncbi:MAG: hypothetical protein A2W59_00045 [Candidatus Terrybacteria bacterium RIFCSPHIGHO2_02_41_19]|uniref:Uncharacterized protein n=1 Tax=Candidatus Terrybacteria bacterium RIFCSPHIGHO2_02_41_19 TaxID=1802364 RepID=A0A1G2PP63_9BACT|nr:MAG: hypothetical protein A2W59_00045 [Candidatus Terrybacteria bacterium RIFCSPHIGHO2_02_41_19]
MPAMLGSKENPIVIGCADISNTNDEIRDCVIRAIQCKFGLNNKVFTSNNREDREDVVVVIKKNNCDNCPIGLNICAVSRVILPKKTINEFKRSMAV